MEYTLSLHKEVKNKTFDGQMGVDDFKNYLKLALESETQLKEELSKFSKDELIKYANSYTIRPSDKKDSIISHIYNDIIAFFALGSYSWSYGQGKYDGIISKVNNFTQKNLDDFAVEVAKEREEYKKRLEAFKKALSNPETLQEYQTFIKYNGKSKLSPEQMAIYDELIGVTTKERQAKEIEQKAVISQVNVSDNVDFNIYETKHTKTGQSLYVVKLSERVSKETYNDLNSKAKKLGGWYSSYTKDGAIAGFQFKDREYAEKFVSLKQGNVSNIEKIEEKQEQKAEKRASKLRENAEAIIERVDKELSKDRQTNTARRASMANSIESRLNGEKAIAKTMINLANAIESGETKFLDLVRTKAQIEQLNNIVQNANYNYLRKKYKSYSEYEAHKYDPITADCIEYISPYRTFFPLIFVENWKRAIDKNENKSGLKLISNKLKKYLSRTKEQDYQIRDKYEMEDFLEFASKIEDSWDNSQIKEFAKDHNRLKSLGVESNEMLRALLREFIQYRGGVQEVDKVKTLERGLAGKKVGIDFFPTPPSVCSEMVEMAEITDGMDVLEPSAGNGNIADAIKSITGVVCDVCEVSSELRAILEAKGYNVVDFDFLSYNEKKYDRIIMNPPFSNRMDGEHIQHAYSLLKPNGRIVAIAGEGIFFGSDKKAVAFRDWLDATNSDVQKLPEKTFTDKSLYATTGANARLIVINKGEEDKEKLKETELIEDIKEDEIIDTNQINNIDMPIMERLPQSVEEIKTENLPSNDVVSMDVLPNTKENNAKIKALKTIENTVGKIFWTGNTTHDNLDKCLTALNLDSANSGWYKPKAAKIKGLKGYYMINQDGSLFCEARVIKQEENKYLIEYLTNEGWNKFENLYSENLDDYQEEIKTENLPIEETQYVANISNDVPTAESKQRFSTVKEIDRTQITTSPKDFQGRQHAYSEESVNKIVSEGFDKTNDPIVVWYDKTIDKYIVISGHSRFEASRRLYEAGDKSLQTMPVKEFLGDKDEAVSYAVLESNRASTQEGLISDINAVRKMLKDGYNKSEMIKYVKPQSYLENIIRYTYLNPNGKFVEYLASPSKSSFPYLERNASWVGDLRKMYSEKLTDLHESEIFDYIYNSGTSKGLKLSKEQLYNLIGSKIMKLDYDNQKPLNLNNIVSTNTIVSPAREKINEMKSDVDYWQKEIQKKQDLIVRARLENNQDLVSKFQTFISDATARVLDIKEKIQKLESEINTVQNSVVRDLFSQVEKTEEIAKIEADYSVYEADKVQNEIEEDIKSDIDNCNNELISFSKQYEKEILQVDSKITINGIDYIVVSCDSEKVKLKQSFGKYNNQEIILTYNEMVEMFSKGKISFDGYSKEDSSLFDLMIKTKQICLIKEGSLNSIKGIANYSVQKISDMAIAIKELSEAKQSIQKQLEQAENEIQENTVTIKELSEAKQSIQKQLEQAENEIQENTVNLLDFDDVSKKIIAKKLQKIQDFMNPAQLSIVKGSNEFDDVINSLYKIIAQTPEIYGTQTVSLHEKIAYLHYFYGGSDWYIIELNKKDIFDENLTIEEPAFGYAILNGDLQKAEFGYIDINELKQFGAELDFHFEPTPMYKLFPNEFEAPMQEIEPATETEQPKETTVDDLKMRIKTIERMIKKGVGDKTQLEMRIKTINRMIAKKQK